MTSKKRFPGSFSAPATGSLPSGQGKNWPSDGPLTGDLPGPAEAFQDPYSFFAGIYDEFMEHVPYAAWAHYLSRRYKALTGRTPSTLVDLACGTGQLLAHFPSRLGRSGVDLSAAMLECARRRLPDVRFEQGRLERPLKFVSGSQAHLICTHDSLNYLTLPEDLGRHFLEVHRILEPGGLYSVDVVSLSNILNNFDNQTLKHRVRGCGLVWKNSYDSKTRLMRSDLEFYLKGARNAGQPSHTERHIQRYYEIDEVRRLASRAGLETVLIEGDYEPRPHRKTDNFWNLHFKKKSAQ